MEKLAMQANRNDPLSTRLNKLYIFILSFALCFSLGLVLNYSRPEIYQNSATLLATAPVAVDQTVTEIDMQHVAIQKNKLLSSDLIFDTFKDLSDSFSVESVANATDLAKILSVGSTEDTNIITLYATSQTPEELPLILNTWINNYLDVRSDHIQTSVTTSTARLETELSLLNAEVESTRKQLDEFRKQHDISSTERDENELSSKLKGLTTALNTANEDVVKAKAKLDAVNDAIARGETVVPQHEQRTLHHLEQRHQELTEQLTELDKQYTREYLALQPALRSLPEQIAKLESEIRKKRQGGQRVVKTEASRGYFAAQQVVKDIQQQLNQHKQKAANFSTLFERQQMLVNDLTSLETLQRETRDRLVKIKSKQFTRFPQVEVLERASLQSSVIAPNYTLGTLLSLAIALLISSLIVWLYNYLTHPGDEPNQYFLSFPTWMRRVSSVNQTLPDKSSKRTPLTSPPVRQLINQAQHKTLNQTQISYLLSNNETDVQQLILLLLSGMTLSEIAELTAQQIKLNYDVVVIDGDSGRNIALGKHLKQLLSQRMDKLWDYPPQPRVEDLHAMLYCAWVDSAMDDIDENEALADILRHTYILYLIDQGIRMTSLSKIVGYLTPVELKTYSDLSHELGHKELQDIQAVYPLCEDASS